jgi:hypothetical protein
VALDGAARLSFSKGQKMKAKRLAWITEEMKSLESCYEAAKHYFEQIKNKDDSNLDMFDTHLCEIALAAGALCLETGQDLGFDPTERGFNNAVFEVDVKMNGPLAEL